MSISSMAQVASGLIERMAARDNPSGVKAIDLGGFSQSTFDARMDTFLPLEPLNITQIGDQSYFPLAIDGSADGALAMTDRRTFAICQEADESVVIFRSATNSIRNGVYYVICKTDGEGVIKTATGTSRPYAPAGLSKIPQTVWCHNHGVLMGMAQDSNGGGSQIYVALTHGTFDAEKHTAALVTGSIGAGTWFNSRCSTFIYNNLVYVLIWATAGEQWSLEVHTCPVSSIVNGGTATFTKQTGFSGKNFEGTVLSGLTHIRLWENLIVGTAPGNAMSIIGGRAGLRNFAVVKGNIARIYCTTAWYINTTSNLPKSGTTIFYVDLNLDTKTYTFSPNVGNATYKPNVDGSLELTGPCTKTVGNADYIDGYWQWGGNNLTGNIVMREDGLVTSCVNDNLAAPQVRQYRIGNYAGNLFDELAKLTPASVQQDSGWVSVYDRVVGATAAHSFVGFMSKSKVYLLSRTPGAQGAFDVRIITNAWDLTYPYKNSVIDVTGFPPSSDVNVVGGINEGVANRFTVIHMGDDQSIVSGSYLHEGRRSSYVNVDADTLAFSGDSISITAEEMTRAAKLCWDAYTGTKITYTQIMGSIVVPPAVTGAPCLMFVSAYNPSTQEHGVLVSEVTTNARAGAITVTSVVATIAYGRNTGIVNITQSPWCWGPMSYRKCTDGWLIAGSLSVRQGTAGNANDFQLRCAKNNSGAWVGAEISWLYQYLNTGGLLYNVHPVWGLGYVDLAVASSLSHGGQIFNAYGPSVAEYLAQTVKTSYMVSTVIAASGYDIYVNEEIGCTFNGRQMTLPVSHYNLKDYDTAPGNKSWYASVVRSGDTLGLAFATTQTGDVVNERVNIGTIQTGATQISTMNLNKVTKLGNTTL